MRFLCFAVFSSFFFLSSCTGDGVGVVDDGREGEGGDEGEGDGGDGGEGEGGGGSVAAGGACGCDDDCAGDATHPGRCAFGVCMQASDGACSAAGSTAECNDGFRCWPLTESDEGTCWPDCASFGCDGECDADGSCAPTQTTFEGCDGTCGEFCSAPDDGGGSGDGGTGLDCSDDDECGEGFVCGTAGRCKLDIGAVPAGPVPQCDDLPTMLCDGDEEFCGELVTFDPRNGEGYNDYPLNGETSSNQYRSFVRRDLRQMIVYAAAATECFGASFPGNGGDIMLGDMSEEDGSIPGTSDGQPGHPADCHERGFDMDIGYYQVNTPDNRLREVCGHIQNGEDQYHCLTEPYGIDIWRTALFLGKMMDHDQFRAAGVDGKAGDLLIEAAEKLCDAGWLEGRVCREGLAVVYDRTEAEDIGWFYFHHHHFHVTIFDQNGIGLPNW